ncbi:MAG: glycosyltransferase family 2 protein [Methanomicrobiaceae archaeon]|nr:glycosyltransferase family 2 protein [Methanomicrobiaceae archaeon]
MEGARTLVIPAYNEERRISRTLSGLSRFHGSLIFVCDGTDRTGEMVRAFARDHPRLSIRCLSPPERLGKGGGVMAGIEAAETPFIGYMDADGSTPLSEMEQLFGFLSDHDGAIGSRWLPESTVPVRQGLIRRLQSRLFNLMVRLLYGLSYQDTQCGAKVFRKEALDAVLPLMRSRGFEFDAELLFLMKKMGFSVVEVPTVWENRGASRVRVIDTLCMLSSLVAVRLAHLK